MKERIVKYLGCPKCNSDLELVKQNICEITNHIMKGELVCDSCRTTYPIINGVPFFGLNISDSEVNQNINNFADEWNYFTSTIDEKLTKEELESYFHTFVKYEDLNENIILDAGCGGGRFSYILAQETNAKEVIGIDLSNAVFTAFNNTKHLDKVTIIQADIRKMPFKKKRIFDFICCVGVIHHLPDPYIGFDALVQHLKENAKLLTWVYGKEGNFLYIKFADPIRKLITSRCPSKYSLYLAWILSFVLWVFIWGFYFPANKLFGRNLTNKLLPLNEYLDFFRRRGFRDFWRTVFDKMIPTIAFYITKEEFQSWHKASNLKYDFAFRNSHSWLGIGHAATKPQTSTLTPRLDYIYKQ